MYSIFNFSSFIIFEINCSDSRDAVPFPIAIIWMLYLLIKSIIVFFDSSYLLCGSCGYITAISSFLPVLSITANLHPVLNAGSKPNTILSFIGGVSNNFSKFLPKFSIALFSPISVSSVRFSLSSLG